MRRIDSSVFKRRVAGTLRRCCLCYTLLAANGGPERGCNVVQVYKMVRWRVQADFLARRGSRDDRRERQFGTPIRGLHRLTKAELEIERQIYTDVEAQTGPSDHGLSGLQLAASHSVGLRE